MNSRLVTLALGLGLFSFLPADPAAAAQQHRDGRAPSVRQDPPHGRRRQKRRRIRRRGDHPPVPKPPSAPGDHARA